MTQKGHTAILCCVVYVFNAVLAEKFGVVEASAAAWKVERVDKTPGLLENVTRDKQLQYRGPKANANRMKINPWPFKSSFHIVIQHSSAPRCCRVRVVQVVPVSSQHRLRPWLALDSSPRALRSAYGTSCINFRDYTHVCNILMPFIDNFFQPQNRHCWGPTRLGGRWHWGCTGPPLLAPVDQHCRDYAGDHI